MNLKISFNIQKDLTHILFEVVLEVGHTNFAGLELEFEILRRFRWICSSVLVDNPGFRGVQQGPKFGFNLRTRVRVSPKFQAV